MNRHRLMNPYSRTTRAPLAHAPSGALSTAERAPSTSAFSGKRKLASCAVSMLAMLAVPACSHVTVKQKPFDAMPITAERPAAPPARVILTPSSIKITEKIQFEFDKAEIKSESHDLLNEIVQVLKDNPQIEQVRVEGHTDNIGTPAYNRKLSKERAVSVREYLTSHGIEGSRLVAEGFGPDRPLESNDTPAGQERNRRVEFNIVKQSAKKTVVQED